MWDGESLKKKKKKKAEARGRKKNQRGEARTADKPPLPASLGTEGPLEALPGLLREGVTAQVSLGRR